ncbi:hypothetical protein PpBr36_04741 [Pyricularia pennisetigena]|uniref:hypothetical protein n=1 Tax=Pyricularia pennisetigena TaxID=1578925 RepID=UPI0011525867|nr:hypothetical protein PpBr36_04741 [Pyricularia pennisetigena]TLS26444.1 hypothetical protein PpBr36_04741 [Pyricularia pennisetigena]
MLSLRLLAVLATALSVNAQVGDMHNNGALVARSAPINSGYQPPASVKTDNTQGAISPAGNRASHRVCHRRGGKLVLRSDVVSGTTSSCVTGGAPPAATTAAAGGYGSDDSVNS